MEDKKIIIITAPSGAGKSTLVKRLTGVCNEIEFAVSACTRQPREGEQHGKDYYFYDETTFQKLVAEDAFIEWEMVYAGKYYGTLKSELKRIWDIHKIPIIDIDVHGALTIQQKQPENAITIFIETPSVDELRKRLKARGTESEQSINERINKATHEMTFASMFKHRVVNEDIDLATAELIRLVKSYTEGIGTQVVMNS